MQTLIDFEGFLEKYNSRDMATPTNRHWCRCYIYDGGWVEIPNLVNVSINREENRYGQTAQIDMVNVNNVTEIGYYNPYRDNGNAWYQRLLPNKKVKITCTIYETTFTIFTGYIVTNNLKANSDYIMSISCKDKGRDIMEYSVNQTKSGVKEYMLNYPIESGVTTVFLTSSDLDPTLEDIVKDMLMRIGFASGDIYCDTTGFTLADLTDTAKHDQFGEFGREADEYDTKEETWSTIIDDILEFTEFMLYIDENEKVYFTKKQERNLHKSCTWTAVAGQTYKFGYIIVKNSVVITSFTENVDYTVDYVNSTITSLLATDEEFVMTFKTADWAFHEGHSIIDLPINFNHNELYGTIITRNDEEEFESIGHLSTVSGGLCTMWDGSQISENKIKVLETIAIKTQGDSNALNVKQIDDMREKYVSIDLNCIPAPWLQVGDVVQVCVYYFINDIYIIDGYDITFTPKGCEYGIRGHHYAEASTFTPTPDPIVEPTLVTEITQKLYASTEDGYIKEYSPNLSEWMTLTTGTGNSLYSMVYHEINDLLYLCGDGAKLYSYDISTFTFTEVVSSYSTETSIKNMIILNNTIYAITYPSYKLVKWTSGSSWTLIENQYLTNNVSCMINLGESIYVGTLEGNLLRHNGIDDWEVVAITIPGVYAITSLVVHAGVVFVGTELGEMFKYNEERLELQKVAVKYDGEHDVTSLLSYNDNLYGTCYGQLLLWNGLDGWTLKADTSGTEYIINKMNVLDDEIYACTDLGTLLKWNGTNAWTVEASTFSMMSDNDLIVL